MKDHLTYKGYIGSIEASVADESFFGKVLYVNDLITFEGSSFKELKQAFEESVDDYLEFCASEGVSPDKTFSGSFNIRIGQDLHKRVSIAATKAGMGLNEFVKSLVEDGCSNKKEPQNLHLHIHSHDAKQKPLSETEAFEITNAAWLSVPSLAIANGCH